MVIDDAYTELGLSPGASEREVKAAWRRLVSQWHPDRNSAATAVGRMQRINTAYEQIRLTRFEPDSAAATDATEAPPAAETRPPGRVIRRRVRLTLEEAALGCVKVLRGKVTNECASCGGRGFHVLASACCDCEGRGVLRQRAWYGWLSATVTCGSCDGERMGRQSCAACGGDGRNTHSYRQAVRIPAGVRHADVLHATETDSLLELRVELSSHDFFVLDDDGVLRCEMPVNGFAWMANRWVDVPTLTGVQQMRLKRGHHVYRLRGQGFPLERRGERGDYEVTVVPTFPDSLNAQQEALLDQLIATRSGTLSTWHDTLQAWGRTRAAKEAKDETR